MLALSPTDTAATDAPFHAAEEDQLHFRLPLAIALPIIAGLSLGLWVLLWKAGQQIIYLVH